MLLKNIKDSTFYVLKKSAIYINFYFKNASITDPSSLKFRQLTLWQFGTKSCPLEDHSVSGYFSMF